MPDNYKDIEELFKDAASNASGPPPPPPDWGTMSSLLQESAVLQTGAGAAKVGFLKALGTKAMMAKVLLGTVVVGGVVTGGYLVLKDSGKGEEGLANTTIQAESETLKKGNGRSTTYAEGLALHSTEKENLQDKSSQAKTLQLSQADRKDRTLLNSTKTDVSTDLSTIYKDGKEANGPKEALTHLENTLAPNAAEDLTRRGLQNPEASQSQQMLADNSEKGAILGTSTELKGTLGDNSTEHSLLVTAAQGNEQSENSNESSSENISLAAASENVPEATSATENNGETLTMESESNPDASALKEASESTQSAAIAGNNEETSTTTEEAAIAAEPHQLLGTETEGSQVTTGVENASDVQNNAIVQSTSEEGKRENSNSIGTTLAETQQDVSIGLQPELTTKPEGASSETQELETGGTQLAEGAIALENQGSENGTEINTPEEGVQEPSSNSIDSLNLSSLDLAQEEEPRTDSKALTEEEKKHLIDSLTRVIDSLAPETSITMGHPEPRWLLSPYVSIDRSNYGIDAITLNNLAGSTRDLRLGSPNGTYSVGLRAAYNVAPYLWLESGFLYSRKSAISGTMELYDENNNINAFANYQLSGDFYEIPIALSVRGNNGYFGWYFKAGVHLTYNRPSAQSFFEYYDYDLEKVFTITPSIQTLNPAITASAGFEYNIKQNLRFYAEPTFRLATRPVLNTNEFNNIPLNPKWNTVGLGVGINYYFGKR